MAFTEENLSVVGGESSEGPSVYTYLVPNGDTATDNFYFDSKYDTFKVNDQIWTDTNGTIALLRVTSSGPALSDGVDVVEVSLGGGGGVDVEIITASANYTLQPSSNSEVWILIDGASYSLTIPDGTGITTGTKYIVVNIGAPSSNYVTINVAGGATVPNITGGVSEIDRNISNQGYSRATILYTGSDTWYVVDDITKNE